MPTTGLPFRVYFFWFGSASEITLGELQRMVDDLLEGSAGAELFGRMPHTSFV